MAVYKFENGLRKVIPYRFQYKTHPKTRWIGKTLVDVYKTEFGEKPSLIEQDISLNSIYVLSNYGRKNGPVVIKGWDNLGERRIDSFDLIYNLKHMHEPSVPQEIEQIEQIEHPEEQNNKLMETVEESNKIVDVAIEWPSQSKTRLNIVFEDHDILVVNKPSGVPTHPTGNYFYNSVTEIVKHDLKLEQVWPCHRLDKVTSGILILAKNKDAAKYYLKIIQNEKETISKEYITRVQGEFPQGEIMVNCPIFSVNSTGGYIKPLNAEQIPTNSTTIFQRIAYNKELNQSVVVCRPLTGRMHQIRIHLRNMDHPIVNDYMYNPTNTKLYNHSINKLNNEIEMELYHRIFKTYPEFHTFSKVDISTIRSEQCIDVYGLTSWNTDQDLLQKVQNLKALRQQGFEKLKLENDTVCNECHRYLFDTDKDMSDLSIWLHAFKYVFPHGDRPFTFKTEYPKWCYI